MYRHVPVYSRPSVQSLRPIPDPLQHDIQRKPDVPDLAMVLCLVLACEDPCGDRACVLKGADLHIVHLLRVEMVLCAGQDENVLLHESGVKVLLVGRFRIKPKEEKFSFALQDVIPADGCCAGAVEAITRNLTRSDPFEPGETNAGRAKFLAGVGQGPVGLCGLLW